MVKVTVVGDVENGMNNNPRVIELPGGQKIEIPAPAPAPMAPAPAPMAPAPAPVCMQHPWYSAWQPWYPPPPPQPQPQPQPQSGPIVIVNKIPAPPPPPAPPTPKVIVKEVIKEVIKVVEVAPPPPPPLPSFSKFSIASVIVFVLGVILSIGAIFGTYKVEELWLDADGNEDELEEDHEYTSTRHISIATGCISTICFFIATLCSFYAGNKYTSRWSKGDKKEKMNCCMKGFVIGAWVIFCFTCVLNLILLVMAFDTGRRVYADMVWVALFGSIFSWMLMFGFSEMARRAS